jgi:hypothetical protein
MKKIRGKRRTAENPNLLKTGKNHQNNETRNHPAPLMGLAQPAFALGGPDQSSGPQ